MASKRLRTILDLDELVGEDPARIELAE